MNDNKINGMSSDSELDAILEEVRRGTLTADSAEEESEPSKTWSLDDIDRLIAQTNGEEYVPKKKEPLTPAEDFKRILRRSEMDTEMFTVKPLSELSEPEPESRDISSVSEEAEVEGQETFFSSDNDDFDESLFEIETVIVPEDIPEPPPIEKPEEPKGPPTIKPFYEGDSPASEFFKKKDEPQPEKKPEHIGENEYRTRFFTKLRLEDTAEIEVEPNGPVDKSGIVLERSGRSVEGGLDPLPKVRAAEDVVREGDDKTKVISGTMPAVKEAKADESDVVEGQIMLTGFDDIPAEVLPEKTSESDVEEELWEKRRQKAKNFRIVNSPELDDGFESDMEAPAEDVLREEKARKKRERKQALEAEESRRVDKEYSDPGERSELHVRLGELNKKATVGLVIAAALEFIMIIFNIIPLLADRLSLSTEIFSMNSPVPNIINAVMLIIAAAIDNERFFDSITGLFKGRVTSHTPSALAIAVALIQNTLAAVVGGQGAEVTVFSVAAVFGVVIEKLADKLRAERTLGNFEVCAYKYEHNMYAVHPIENESEIFELGKGLLMGNAELLYSSKVGFTTDFLKNSAADSSDRKLVRLLLPCSAAASVICAVAVGIINKSAMAAISAFAGTFCVTSPLFVSIIPALIERVNGRRLNPEGTMIVSLDSAEKTAAANAVVMDSADIFDRSRCTMHGMKNYENIRIDDVLLYAAALVIKSGGPLRESFEQVIDGRQDLLPPVRELTYEDKLGIAARIHNQKVLFGNRNLLVHHNIQMPDKAIEEKYSHDGRKVIYLAVAESIAAMFVVSYAVDRNLGKYFKVLEENGIQVLVRTNDVNVTEELIADSFGLPQETFKVLSAVAGKLFKRRRDAVCDKLPASIVHDGTAYSMLRSVAASCGMESSKKLGTVAQIVLSALGFVLSTALYCTGLGSLMSGLTALGFLVVGLAVCSGVALINKI